MSIYIIAINFVRGRAADKLTSLDILFLSVVE